MSVLKIGSNKIILGTSGEGEIYVSGGDLHINCPDGSTLFDGQSAGGGSSVTSVFSAHRAAGGLTLANSSTAVTFDTEDLKDDDYSFSAPGDEIIINTTGTYLVQFAGSAGIASTTRRECSWWLEKDPLGAGSWSEVGGARAYTYHRTNGVENNTASIARAMNLTATDKLRFRAQSTNATDVTSTANGIRVDIVRLK